MPRPSENVLAYELRQEILEALAENEGKVYRNALRKKHDEVSECDFGLAFNAAKDLLEKEQVFLKSLRGGGVYERASTKYLPHRAASRIAKGLRMQGRAREFISDALAVPELENGAKAVLGRMSEQADRLLEAQHRKLREANRKKPPGL